MGVSSSERESARRRSETIMMYPRPNSSVLNVNTGNNGDFDPESERTYLESNCIMWLKTKFGK